MTWGVITGDPLAFVFFKKNFFNCIDFKEEGEKEREICCFTYLFTHWLILV